LNIAKTDKSESMPDAFNKNNQVQEGERNGGSEGGERKGKCSL
jgi:hypothetical protein